MNTASAVKYGLMGLAIIGSFVAGNMVVKWYQETTPAAKEAKAMVNQFRPDFVLPDIEGVSHSISEWSDKVVVLNFWATWCPPCVEEMPEFVSLQEAYGHRGLQFVGIALDDPEKVEDFVDTLGVDYPILLGGDDAISVSNAYGNRLGALPYTVVINREGNIVKTYRGQVSRSSVEKVITKNL